MPVKVGQPVAPRSAKRQPGGHQEEATVPADYQRDLTSLPQRPDALGQPPGMLDDQPLIAQPPRGRIVGVASWQHHPGSTAPNSAKRRNSPASRSASGALAHPGTLVGCGGRNPRLLGADTNAMVIRRPSPRWVPMRLSRLSTLVLGR